ncbi:MAG: MCE family protein [Flavobacterium sp.]|nr:MCE family protein [Flavobacterium sp.]
MNYSKEIKTALLVIASISLLIWGYGYLKGKDIFSRYNTYSVYFDNVEGLTKSAAITLNGLAVGKIADIKLAANQSGKMEVSFQVDSDIPVTKSTVASLYEPGFIGGKQIMLLLNSDDTTLAPSGYVLKGTVKSGMTELVAEKLAPIQQKLELFLERSTVLLTNVNSVLDDKAKADIKNSIAELNATMQEMHQLSASANKLVNDNAKNMNAAMADIKTSSGNFAKISDSLQKADLGKTVRTLESSLEKVNVLLTNLNEGKGTMGKLAKDEALYNNLQKTAKEMELLLQDVRLHPTRYVNVSLFGKKEKPYKTPVSDTLIQK